MIVVGAGASYDCAVGRPGPSRSPDSNWRPPLTWQLFEPRQVFGPILDAYPGARNTATEIRVRLDRSAEPDTFALEKYLREELRESENADARWRFRQVPLYLQHLLFEVSKSYTTDPENYSRLVTGALGAGLDNVVFLTLNYDTILDRELFYRTPVGAATGNPDNLTDYVSEEQPWILVKLHGSVNWVRRVLVTPSDLPGDPYEVAFFELIASDIEAGKLDDAIELRIATRVQTLRRSDGLLCYPALSVPIGPDPELANCPPAHIEALRGRLARMGGSLNVLFVGYSGLDDEVLDILGEAGTINTIGIVDLDPQTIHERLERKFGPLAKVQYLPGGGFSGWAQSLDVERFFQSIAASG